MAKKKKTTKKRLKRVKAKAKKRIAKIRVAKTRKKVKPKPKLKRKLKPKKKAKAIKKIKARKKVKKVSLKARAKPRKKAKPKTKKKYKKKPAKKPKIKKKAKKAKPKKIKKTPKKNIRRVKIVKRVITKKEEKPKLIVAKTESKKEEDNGEKVHKTKIRVIGIGGGADSIVSEIASDIKKADFIVANTDTKSLQELSKKVKKFQFGQDITKGLGTGMNDQAGEAAALADKEKIKKLLEGQDLCIIVSCLGGGTSSGATPVFAKISKSLGNLTYGIFTLPFEFEGEKKMEMALNALEKIKPCLNAYSVIPNERIFQIIDKNTPLKSALSAINQRLADNLEGLIEMIYHPGLINIDFADLGAVLSGKGKLSYLSKIEIDTLGKEESVKKVISSPLYPYTIKGAKGILYNIKGGNNLKLSEVSYISKIISESINKQAKIIFGITQTKNKGSSINITLLAVGCQGKFLSLKAIKEIKKVPEISQKPITEKKQEKKPATKTLRKKPVKKTKQENKKSKKAVLTAVSEKTIQASNAVIGKNIIPEEIKVKVRRNGIELKKVVEAEEKELIDQEKAWETPAILRKKI